MSDLFFINASVYNRKFIDGTSIDQHLKDARIEWADARVN